MHLGLATLALARVALAQGSPAEAETLAREACDVAEGLIIYQLLARTCLSTALLAQGRAAEARAEAEKGVRELERVRGPAVGLWLAMAESCQASGMSRRPKAPCAGRWSACTRRPWSFPTRRPASGF